MAAALVVSVAWLAFLAAPPAPGKPAASKRPGGGGFDLVLPGKLAPGRILDFPAILLPPTAIQTTSAGKTRYFVLAVRKDSAYFRGLAETAQALRDKAPEKLKLLAASTTDDKQYRAAMSGLDELLNAAIGAKTARLATVEPGEAIGVEVTGLGALGSAYNWETVSEKKPWEVPFIGAPPSSPQGVPASLRGWDEVGTRLALVNFSLDRPPDLARRLPDFTTEKQFTDARELEAYNATVELFNTELVRRRNYAAQRTSEEVRLALEQLERFLALQEQTLQATVIAKPSLAAETYSRIYGRAPAAFVRDRAKPEVAFAKRSFRTARLLVASYPPGAKVSIDGRDAGVTPVTTGDLPVGSRVKIVATLPGFRPKETEETIGPQPSLVKRLELSLDSELSAPARRMTPEEAKRLFAPAYTPTKKFTLAALATSERPGFVGKKDKDGAKRAEAIRKAAAAASGPTYAGWFDQSASPDVAEVTLEIGVPDAGTTKDAKNDRIFRVTYRGGQEEESLREVISLADDRAGADRILLRIMEELKHRHWARALGGT